MCALAIPLAGAGRDAASRSPLNRARLAALFADPVNLKGVARGQVVVSASDFLLQVANLGGKEFHRAATLGAHHVVMAAAIILMFVARNAVVKSHFAGQATFGKQLKRAVHGGVSDAGVFPLYQAMQFVG